MGLGLVAAVQRQARGGSHQLEARESGRISEESSEVLREEKPFVQLGAEPERMVEARELNYTFAGGYTRQWVRPELAGRLEDGGCDAPFAQKPFRPRSRHRRASQSRTSRPSARRPPELRPSRACGGALVRCSLL